MSSKCLEYESTAIERLEADCKLFAIRVTESATDKIELSWRDTTMRNLEVKQEGKTLKLIDHAAVGIYGTLALINLKKDDELLIKLPASFAGKAIFQTKSEGINLADLKFSGDLGIASNAGEIFLENVNASKIDIRANACKVNCYGLSVAQTLDISSKSGFIKCYIDGTEDEYTVFCNSERRRASSRPALRSDVRHVDYGAKEIQTTGDCALGFGPKKVCITSETGKIDFAFQNGVKTRKTAGRYQPRNSFKDW